MWSTLVGLCLLSAVLPFVALADFHHHHNARKHHELARRPAGELSTHKRQSYDNARLTYYAVGLGACGITNVPSDFIVALDSTLYGSGYPGPNCWKMITINCNGVTAVAEITDECPGCPEGGLDLSQGLFSFFADISVGVLYCDWWYNDPSSSSSSSSSTWSSSSSSWTPPTSTWTPPPPTTTWTPASSSSSWTPPPSSSSSSWSSTWSSSSSSSTPTSTSTSSSWSSSSTSTSTSWSSSSSSSSASADYTADNLAVPTGTAEATETGPAVLSNINQAILGIGAIFVAAAQ